MDKICPILSVGALAGNRLREDEIYPECGKDKCALWVSVPSDKQVDAGFIKTLPDRSHCGLIKGSE